MISGFSLETEVSEISFEDTHLPVAMCRIVVLCFEAHGLSYVVEIGL